MWEYYRFDFSTTGVNKAPSNSWKWELRKQGWVARIADAPIDVSDAELPFLIQIDTNSTNLGLHWPVSCDVNIAACAVNFASTGTLGGRFDNASSGYYSEIKAIPDGLINSQALVSCPPMFRLRFDNNTSCASSTGISNCCAFISFRRKYQ